MEEGDDAQGGVAGAVEAEGATGAGELCGCAQLVDDMVTTGPLAAGSTDRQVDGGVEDACRVVCGDRVGAVVGGVGVLSFERGDDRLSARDRISSAGGNGPTGPNPVRSRVPYAGRNLARSL